MVNVNTNGFDPVIAAAVVQARDAVQSSPRSAAMRGRMGKLLLAHEVWPEARECFAQAMALAPREPRWPYFLGLAHLADNPMAAVTNLERAVRLLPERESAPRLKLAETLLGLGRLEEAEVLYRHVRERESNSAPAALGLGKVANARDQLSEAADFLTAATVNASTRKAAHRLLLNVNQRLGRSNEVERIARALTDLPNDEGLPDPFFSEVEQLKTGEEAWIDRADKWTKEGQVAEAARLLEKTIQTYPRSHRAMFFLGRARLRLGDAAGAETILLRAVELAPDSVEAQLQLGVTRLSRGRPKEAQPCFRAAIKAKPNLGEAWFNLGLSLGAENERPECVAAFREAIRLRPNLIEAYLGLAVVLRADGQRQVAAGELRRALELEPSEPLRRKLLGQLELVERPGRGESR
jgi:tetratricopeptide (TPR) repeat protein